MVLENLFGLGFILLGFVSISSYTDNLSHIRVRFFHKELQPMRERWGADLGTALHFVEYVLIPLGIGLLLLKGLSA